MKENIGITTFMGNPLTLLGNMVKVGDKAPYFTALNKDLTPFCLCDIKDKVVVISVVPSIDTPVCDTQTRHFNQEAAEMKDVQFISISCDLPFAIGRYCAVAGIESVITLSDHKDTDFGLKYGFLIKELRLLNRGIVIIDKDGKIAYVEYVKENTTPPNYDAALDALKKLQKK